MKLDGLTHPKTKELAYTLGVPLPHAIGLLELTWAFVGQQTPQGNIGKWSNAVIAGEAGWQGDADEFVSALVTVGFLDEHEEHRLLVHDWADHCPNWVHAKLKKTGKQIISADLSGDLRGRYKPSQDKPSEDKTSEEQPLSSSQKREPDRSDEVREVFSHWQTVHGHQRAKLDDKRYRNIRARLKDGYTVDDLKTAVNGCAKSPHHQGENDRATVYDDIELICRSAKHVDQFIRFADGPDLTSMSKSARQTAIAAAEWITEGNA